MVDMCMRQITGDVAKVGNQRVSCRTPRWKREVHGSFTSDLPKSIGHLVGMATHSMSGFLTDPTIVRPKAFSPL